MQRYRSNDQVKSSESIERLCTVTLQWLEDYLVLRVECCSSWSKRTVQTKFNAYRRYTNSMSRSFLVDSLIGNNSPPAYPLPYYGNQLPSYMFNFFNLGLGYQPIRPVPRPPVMPVPVPISPPALGSLRPVPGQSPPSPLNTSTSKLSGKYLLLFFDIKFFEVEFPSCKRNPS